MDAEVYPNQGVAAFIRDRFVPVRVHVKDNPDEFKRLGAQFNAQWTPTTLVVDPSGGERHRVEGFLPVDDYLSQLTLGLAKAAFARGEYTEAERLYQQVVAEFANSDAAPEAQYWAGVSRYKATGDAAALAETTRRFDQRYSDSVWAKKASVWRE